MSVPQTPMIVMKMQSALTWWTALSVYVLQASRGMEELTAQVQTQYELWEDMQHDNIMPLLLQMSMSVS